MNVNHHLQCIVMEWEVGFEKGEIKNQSCMCNLAVHMQDLTMATMQII
jgi:hypothetical protein